MNFGLGVQQKRTSSSVIRRAGDQTFSCSLLLEIVGRASLYLAKILGGCGDFRRDSLADQTRPYQAVPGLSRRLQRQPAATLLVFGRQDRGLARAGSPINPQSGSFQSRVLPLWSVIIMTL
jgi:hypothetical protein